MNRLAKKMDKGFACWLSYITHPGIEPTNNLAEQSLREPVVVRKIVGCFRNEKGTHIYETITTVLATWKKRGYNTFQMLAQTLTNNGLGPRHLRLGKSIRLRRPSWLA